MYFPFGLVVLLIFYAFYVWVNNKIYIGDSNTTEKGEEINKFFSNVYNNSLPQATDFHNIENNSSQESNAHQIRFKFAASLNLNLSNITDAAASYFNNYVNNFNVDPNQKVDQATEDKSEHNASTTVTLVSYTTSELVKKISSIAVSKSTMQTPTSTWPTSTEWSTPDLFTSESTSPLKNSFIDTNSPRTISEIKCDEYSKQFDCTRFWYEVIGGGTPANEGEFRHMVALGRRDSNGNFTLVCGGSLISHTWVLSAAHCTHSASGSPTEVRIGTNSLKYNTSGVTVAIKRMIRHSDYKPPALYADIALIELVRSVGFGGLIRPACLYQQNDSSYTIMENAFFYVMISGWGATSYYEVWNNWLHKADVTLIDNSECMNIYNKSREIPHGITPDMICTGLSYDGYVKDTCPGDSGGPLQIVHRRNLCFYQVIGITSFGLGCTLKESPGVYTRVSSYLSWIENIVWPQIP